MSGVNTEDPKVFVIARELSEVHLLLDNLAANPATNLSAITKSTRPDGLDDNWIEEICQVNWPPAAHAPAQAKQAALLIRAKDYLNSLTYPASGATIAFTLLVTQEAEDPRTRQPRRADSAAAPVAQRIADAPSRRSMACAAYPDLAVKAAGFRRMITRLNVFMLGWLVLTCLMSWYVAFGNAQLANLEQAQAKVVEASARVDTAQAAAATPDPVVNARAAANTAISDPCRPPINRVDLSQACRALDAATGDVVRTERSLAKWLFQPIGAGRLANGPAIAAYAAALANIIGSAVLPFLYGLLGAAAAVVRSLSRKTRHSLLSPRDLQLSLQQLALGAVVGASIGLFFGQTSGGNGDSGLIGPVALSSSALSFIAGFGVDAVFQTLEALILRIFNVNPPATPPALVPLPVTKETGASPTPSPSPAPAPTPAPASTENTALPEPEPQDIIGDGLQTATPPASDSDPGAATPAPDSDAPPNSDDLPAPTPSPPIVPDGEGDVAALKGTTTP